MKGVTVRPGSIRVTFTYEGAQHHKTLQVNGEWMKPNPANLKFAARLVDEIRDRIRHGAFSMAEYFPASGAAGSNTVGAQLDTWLGGQRIEASTRAGYASAIRFWKTAHCNDRDACLGDRPLRNVRTSEILYALNTRPGLSGKTANNYISVLREALELAVVDKMMTDNPVEHVPRATYQKPPVDPFTAAEVEAILADMRAHYPVQVVQFAEFKFFTGLRTSEAFGLRWANVDLPAASVVVREGVVRGVEVDRTKTNRVRTVFLNSRALAAIQAQRTATYLVGEHVFHDPRYGERWGDERAFRRSYWHPTLRRLAMRYRPPYNTRHSYASAMLMAGMRPAFCAGQMGHSVEIFHSTYAKWIPGAGDASEMAKLEQALGGQESNKGAAA